MRGAVYYAAETAAEVISPVPLGLSDPDASIHPLASNSQSSTWLTGSNQASEDYAAFKEKYGRGAQVVEGAATMKLGGKAGKVIGAVVILGAVVSGGKEKFEGVQGEDGSLGPDKGDRDPLPAQKEVEARQSQLLPREGRSGTFDQLKKAGSVGDDLTPHHVPPDDYMRKMEVPGYTRGEGLAINMEQPPVGGRHRQTENYGKASDTSVQPRTMLARAVADVRRVYREAGEYTTEIRAELMNLIRENKTKWGQVFKAK